MIPQPDPFPPIWDPAIMEPFVRECIYEMTDTPSMEIAGTRANFSVRFEFIGRIRDTCHGDAIVEEKVFHFELAGSTAWEPPVAFGGAGGWRLSGGLRTRGAIEGVPIDATRPMGDSEQGCQ
jgi:hypothetical protein